ncbi:MAG: hypothetical protein AAGH60_01090 [Pseudomonadota bacterium]
MGGQSEECSGHDVRPLHFVRAPMPLFEKVAVPPGVLEQKRKLRRIAPVFQRGAWLGVAVAAAVIGLVENSMRFSDPASIAGESLSSSQGADQGLSEAPRENRLSSPFAD